ncbi:MAG: peptide deformylase [SAR86 cluster bacterium]|uniref:Peptide deformylase n=1 Tax=SAR86 cluster bacterium TaxID=2030880 RepID=A0A937HW41_9GAMM|nr:peptide deformylase [SAR86 cluster bacterium]
MAIRKILKFPDQDLRIKAKPVETFDEELKTLTDDMFETMHSVNGIGLAATQIGIAKQVAVIDISPEKNEPLVIVNPAIQNLDPSKTEDYDEGCLSVPGFFEKISRPSDIKLSYQDLNGKKQEIKPEGLLTKVVQHELDHLNGRLFVDHISELKRRRIRNKIVKQK